MNEREQANQFSADLEAWLEHGKMPTPHGGSETSAPHGGSEASTPQGGSEASEASDASEVSETYAGYRQALEIACRLAQANTSADPGFRLGLEKRLRGRARAELPRLAQQSRVREGFAAVWRVGAGAALVAVFVLGLSFLFKSVRPWGAAGLTPTPEPTQVPTVLLAPTVLVQQVTTPAAIPLIPPTPVPGNLFPTPTATDLQVTQSSDGSWTSYSDPAWQQNGESNFGIYSIAIGPDGAVWASTVGKSGSNGIGPDTPGAGTYRLAQGNWTRFTDQDGIPSSAVLDMVVGPDGKLWFATACCGVSSFDGKTWTTYTTANGLPTNNIWHLAFAPDGALWLGTADKGAVRFDGKTWQDFPLEASGVGGARVLAIGVLPDSSLLFSTISNDTFQFSLSHFDGQTWSQYAPQGGPLVGANDVASAPDGSLWFTTGNDGVYRLKDGAWTHYTTQDGLAGNEVKPVVISPDNVAWFGTYNGLSRFDGTHWTTFTGQDGLPLAPDGKPWISALAIAPDGALWVGGWGSITRFSPALSLQPTPTLLAGDLNLQSSHADIRARMFNPIWQTLWIQGEASTISSVGVKENTYMQAWLGRDGTGRVLFTGPIPGSFGFSLDMTVQDIWVSDGKAITSLDIPRGQPATLSPGIMHPLDRTDPVLGIVFPSYLAVRSEDLQVVKMDEQAGRLALVATWASYRLWIDVQTGLILRSQTLDPGGQVTQDIRVLAILVDGEIPAGELSTESLDQARFERAPAGVSAIDYSAGPDSPIPAVNGSIVFSASTDRGVELFSMDAQGANLTQLTHDNANNVSPACAVDGSWIAFTSIRDNQAAIYLIHPDGSGERRLADSSSFVDLSFSPDGQKIAFVSDRDGNAEIYIIGIDGSGLTRLTDNPAVDDSPAWSPDGKQIAFITNRDGPYQVYGMAADGSAQTNLSNSSSDDLQPAWSPDGSRIAFYSSERGGDNPASEIYVMRPDGSVITPLTASPQGAETRQFYNPAWSPDGQRMAFYSEYDGSDGTIKSRGILKMLSDGSGLSGQIIQLTPNTENPNLDATGRPCWLPAASTPPGVQPTLAAPDPAGTQTPAGTPVSIFVLPALPRLLRRKER